MEQNKEDIIRYLKFLAHEGISEIRPIKPRWKQEEDKDEKYEPISIFVNNEKDFVKAIEEFNKANPIHNFYVGLNARSKNGKSDGDVSLITNIGHDIDAHGDINNKAIAGQIALDMIKTCIDLGYKEPLLIDSGRGYWVIHHLPGIKNTPDNITKIKEFGKKIKKQHEKEGIEFDTAVYNPSRIARIPGTINVSDKNNFALSMIMNNPSGEEDNKLQEEILAIEIPTYKPQAIIGIPGITQQGICSFMDYCLTHQIPEGERNRTINKNLAVYLVNHPQRAILREQYLKIQESMAPGDLDGWIKQIEQAPDKYAFNIGELVNFTKKYKIPFDWRVTPEYKKWKKEKDAEKRLADAVEFEKESKKNQEVLKTSEDKIKRNAILKSSLLEAQDRGEQINIDIALENIVVEIKKRMYIKTWRDDLKPEVWIYLDGKYVPNGESSIKEELREILGASFSTYIANKIIERIKIDTHIDQEVFVTQALNHSMEINVKNGIINIDPEDYSIKLERHTPEKIFINQIPINYKPEADCTNIDKFLSEALSSPEDKETVYEAMGTAMDPSLITKKALIAFGPKDTGKTTWLHLAQRFYGIENCSNLNIKQLTEHAFLKSKLFGKFANISSEISSEEVKNMEEFKALTGGDFMEGDRKFKNAISFRNLAKFFFGCNLLPRIYNADDAFWGRLVPLPFTKVAIPQEVYDGLTEEEKKNKVIKDEKLRDKLTTDEELSGLLNKALEGLISYYKHNNLSYSKSLEEVKMAWIRDSDSFLAFCLDHIEQGNFHSDCIIKKDLSNKYMRYCSKNKVRTCSDKAIKATLNSLYGVSLEFNDNKHSTGQRDENGNLIYERAWEGIKWKGGL